MGHPITAKLAGPYDAALEARTAALELGGAVTFLGTLEREALKAFYQSLDLFAISSRQEGLNIAGLEAMACGVPVVSTRCGGPEDYVRDGENGYLCDMDAQDLAKKMAHVCSDREKRAAMGAAARRIAETEYSHAVFARILADIWSAVWPDDKTVPKRAAP